jgi:Flp pilus assembly protein TadG
MSRASGGYKGSLRRSKRNRGQSLVEFALVFPIFFTLLLGLIEFAFVFNAILAVNYAARDAALSAAEAGDRSGADCIILDSVDRAISAPSDDSRVVSVEIFRASSSGAVIGAATLYTRDAPSAPGTSCTYADSTTLTVHFTLTTDGYPIAARCNVLGGCDGGTSVDNIAVRVTYTHPWITPISTFAGGGFGGLTFQRTSIMRMEPIL